MTARTRQLGGWAVLLVAALVCGLGAWSYGQARGDESLAYAKARDAALADGRRHLTTLNSLDGTDAKRVDTGLRAWLESSTGPLRDELERTRGGRREVPDDGGRHGQGQGHVGRAHRTGRAHGDCGADRHRGRRGHPALRRGLSTQRKRFGATLARTADGWKVKALAAIGTDGGR